MPFIVIGLSHHSSSVAVRERFAFAEDALPAALEKLRRETGAPNSHPVLAPLDLQLRNPGLACQIDQLADLIDSHQWISLAEWSRPPAPPRAGLVP